MTDQYEDWRIFNSPGECPVAEGTRVQIHSASETRHQAEQRPPHVASTWVWDLGVGHSGRVIAYRILKEPKLSKPDWNMVQVYATRVASHASGAAYHKRASIFQFAKLANALGYDIVKQEAGK